MIEINEKAKDNLIPLHFTMSRKQYKNLKFLKDKGYCKIMYILRLAAVYISYTDTNNVKSYKDMDFNAKEGKHYKVDLPKEIYLKIENKKNETGFSMSKLLRIGLNDVLNFMENQEEKNE